MADHKYHTDKIAALKKELAKYDVKEEKVTQYIKEEREIADLKKQIRQKKYAGVVRTGKNLKTIGKNVYHVTKAVGRGVGKFIGEDPNVKKGGKKRKTVEEIMRELPK